MRAGVKKRAMADACDLNQRSQASAGETGADDENGLCGQFDNYLGARAEAVFAPAIEDSANQVISNRIALSNQLVTFFAFPFAACAAFRLFEYHSHLICGRCRPTPPSLDLR
jgi:hypothetical protein